VVRALLTSIHSSISSKRICKSRTICRASLPRVARCAKRGSS
jgi:hypothetical protein